MNFFTSKHMNQLINLYPNIYKNENLEESWNETKVKIQEQLEKGIYKPSPARRVYIPKANAKKRALGIPIIKDRVIQQSTRRIIESILDPKFEDFSYGFRPNKSAKQALEKVDKILETQKWAIQIDLEKFFNTIPHKTIMEELEKQITDEKVLSLIQQFLKAGVMEQGQIRYATTGTPQGGVISPILANLVLDVVDKYVKSHGNEGMVRYANDSVILCKTRRRAEHVYKEVLAVLKRLGLKVNEEKSRIGHVSEKFIFLGY